ncbi:DUF2141 domain-containing protein [Hymenobacter chitinivorans]|uniref:Uncharacterized protein (DUF2141 family) n=1 Tax=Hymenobacter chitinivorans DSM 11115 TaxID=1121954 RepID=A0A2M9AS79_9BACT|nr:DUF2141 domain-containing protein [Hymenobacter chitinivorans]PJJ48549.1 uncharacterized protein (DUF2141 family) [Hymenobacter chitinivorans DSM 11115]
MKILPVAFLAAGCTLLSAATSPTTSAPVQVVVTDLPSTKATVKLYFYNVKENFLKRGNYTLLKYVKPGGSKQITLPIDLPNGEWAVALTQDLNDNDLVDKNFMGIPTEPYAFSNNVRPKLAPPEFDECKFVVNGAAQVVTISMRK